MRFVLFCHSLISDWNHGNAHFLRGLVVELLTRGHQVTVYEPADAWSRLQLLAEQGDAAVSRFRAAFPALDPHIADLDALSLDEALEAADVVLVHEWSSHRLVERLSAHRLRSGSRYTLLFHDTHHRSVTDSPAMGAYQLEGFDGVLAFGEVIRERYLAHGWSRRAWTWHEAADVRVFTPKPDARPERDLIWIGNWGDDERSQEIGTFLIEPVRELGLSATVYGVRYPDAALTQIAEAGASYGEWIANYDAPAAYARHRMTVHIPRRPYVAALPGIPTIRMFEALACGIPLVSLPWHDVEGLFRAGEDFLVARTPSEMRARLRDLQHDAALRQAIANHGLATIRQRHTCAHRVDELMAILREVGQVSQREEVLSR
jgi:spore maturation protein CgeB